MFNKIATERADVNSVLEEISDAVRSAKAAAGNVNWVHTIEIKVNKMGTISIASDPTTDIDRAIIGLTAAKARFEAAVAKLDELQSNYSRTIIQNITVEVAPGCNLSGLIKAFKKKTVKLP